MMTSILTRALDPTQRRGCAFARSIARVFRNHIRAVVVALVVSLLVAAMFSAPSAEGAADLPPKLLPEGDPTNLVVSAISNTTISLSWTAAGEGAAHYRVERSENISGPFVFVQNVTGTTFTDTTVTSLHAYLYRVIAVTADACPSVPSNVALGTAISFEFSTLSGQRIKAQHLHDVRTAINAVRAVANLPSANWTRGTLTNLEIRAEDVLEMRTRLDEALNALEILIDPYQDPNLIAGANGTPIKAIHIEQLQTRSTRGVFTTPNPLVSSSALSEIGAFDPPITLPLVPVHLSVLPDGRVLFWGRDRSMVGNRVNEASGKSEAYIWNVDAGSNKTDLAVFRPSESKWYITSQTGAVRVVPWGLGGDRPVTGDYDGDGSADLAVFRPSNGLWSIVNSSNGTVTEIVFGTNGDVPVQGDYDQDGKTDLAIFRPSNSTWHIRKSSNPNGPDMVQQWGESGDVPVPGDYDQDRKTDIAIFRPSQNKWHILKSSSSSSNPSAMIAFFGEAQDVVAPGDYSGDGATDLAVYRPRDGKWYIRNIVTDANQNFFVGQAVSAVVAPGDYDGDGKTDAAIFRPLEGNWQIRNSSNEITEIKSWGQNGDIPVPKDYDGMLRVANTTTNVFCSGHSFLPDGRLLVIGGHKDVEADGDGETHINIFDFRSNSWVKGPDMNNGRWYPYNVTLGSGKTLIVSGSYFQQPTDPSTRKVNTVPQIYNPGTGCLEDDPIDAGDEFFSLYPFLHLRPDGKVVQIQSPAIVNVDGRLEVVDDRRSRLFDPDPPTGPWLPFGSTRSEHSSGSAVVFESGRKVLVVGGFTDENLEAVTPSREAEYIDLQAPNASWTRVPPMNSKRAYHTATILPDGKVLVTGGVSCPGSNNIDCDDGAAMDAEMWDPTSNPACLTQIPWRTMARQSKVRAYHSTAALLPDGRVLVAGGGSPGAVGETDFNGRVIQDLRTSQAKLFGNKTVELYSPPYLFSGARPVINSAPASIFYGQTFFVGTSNDGDTPKVSLVRLASVTHGFNQDQRHLFLSTPSSNASGINVTAPTDSKICPPGYYMLFVLNNGVPSIAKIVRVGPASIFLTEAPQTTADGQGSTWEQGVEFSSSVNGQITHIRFWKAANEMPGNHFGRIWTATGNPLVPLAVAPFTCETASGWQQAELQTPLQITAGVRYRVSYNARTVAKTPNALDSPITIGPLTVWDSWFSQNAGTFPSTRSHSNLFADIVFKPGP